jgi:hypothetical protein
MTSFTESEYGTSQKCSDNSELSDDGFMSSEDGDDEGMFFFFSTVQRS